MQPSEYYSEIGRSNIANEVWSLVNDGAEWKAHNSFLAKQIPEHIYLQEPLLKYLSIKHSLLVGILMMHPFHVYNWHTDGNRRCGINLLLSDSPSHCLFTDDETITNSKVIELSYMPTTYYVFNTQVNHMVLNFEQPRLLLTIEFGEDKDALSFDDLLLELL